MSAEAICFGSLCKPTKSSKQTLNNKISGKNKINFRWLKRENIDYKFSRSGLIKILLNENNSSNIMFVDKDVFITYNVYMIVFW